jgi:hypothetical protein
MLNRSFCTLAIMTVALSWLIAPAAVANTITLDFESAVPNAGNGPAYLSSYGITLSGISPSGPADTMDIYNISGGGSLWVNTNFLEQLGTGAVACTYTINFSTPLTSLSFERIATPSNLVTEPLWSATAYAGATPVGTVGESLNSWGNSPAHPFTIIGSGITSLAISANGFGFTAIGSVPLDNFVLTQVPEPSSLMSGAVGIASLGLVGRRIKRRGARD